MFENRRCCAYICTNIETFHMMRLTLQKLFSALVLSVFALGLIAQPAKKYNTWTVGLKVGPQVFFGDIRQYDFYPLMASDKYAKAETKFSFGLFANKMFTPVFGIQANGMYGQLQGTNRPYWFKTNTLEGSVNGIINFSNLFRNPYANKPTKKIRLGVYGMAGIGLLQFDSELRRLESNKFVDKSDQTVEVIFPTALGFKVHLPKNIDVGLEANYRFVNSDKLDGYYRYDDFNVNNNKTRKVGNNDSYAGLYLVGSYTFGKGENIDRIDNRQVMYDELAAASAKAEEAAKNAKKEAVSTNDETLDSDNDGVPDYRDKQPNSPAGGVKNPDGIMVISQSELDALKSINNINVKVENIGSDLELIKRLFANWNIAIIYFDFNKAIVKDKYYTELSQLAYLMKMIPEISVKLIGHADIRGGEAYNLSLSEKRSDAVKKILVDAYKLDVSRINIAPEGEAKALSEWNVEKAQTPNRRVEFRIFFKGKELFDKSAK